MSVAESQKRFDKVMRDQKKKCGDLIAKIEKYLSKDGINPQVIVDLEDELTNLRQLHSSYTDGLSSEHVSARTYRFNLANQNVNRLMK
jgi:hypothetical protein